jgi:hypothetical protein
MLDAILQHVASWGDRIPHGLNKGNVVHTVKVKTEIDLTRGVALT